MGRGPSPRPPGVALLGLPSDVNSSHRRGAAAAPPRIREALFSPASNLASETGVDLGAPGLLADEGDLALDQGPGDRERIEAAVAGLIARGRRPLLLGGDHSVTYPAVRAVAAAHPRLSLLHVDAHPDLYDAFEGSRLSHACPFARILEEGLARRLVQVGIRTQNAPQRAQAGRFGVEQVDMRAWRPDLVVAADGPVYVSVDIDVLDPAFAPGVSHPEPGGLSTREAIGFLQRLRGTVVGADVVELNPSRDAGDATARVAAKLAKELLARLLSD